MKIFNATPHDINIMTGAEYRPEIRKYVGGNIVRTIEKSGELLNVQFTVKEEEPLDGIPIQRKVVYSIDHLPEGYEYIIVSAVYAAAYEEPDRHRLLCVADPVYSEDGRTVLGCRALQAAR